MAIVLAVLGEDVAEPLLGQLSPSRRERVRQRVASFSKLPPPDCDVDRVMEDFERFLRFVEKSTTTTPRLADLPDEGEPHEPPTDNRNLLRSSKDSIADLKRLQAYQIAGALQREHPRTIAIVLNQVPTEKVSQTLSFLPPDTRTDVFLQLRDRPQGSQHLVEQIARATFENGRVITEDDMVADNTGGDERLAAILRSLEKKERNELLSVIEEHDAETAQRVKDALYVFNDIKRIEDRSLQKLLLDVDTRVLATAMKDADETLVEKVLNNLPRRARDMLTEELQFMGPVSEDNREAARQEITGVIAQLDQTGDLMMES